MKNSHNIYLISDSTGETLDRIFLALKAQFESFDYQINQFSFTRTETQRPGLKFGQTGRGKQSLEEVYKYSTHESIVEFEKKLISEKTFRDRARVKKQRDLMPLHKKKQKDKERHANLTDKQLEDKRRRNKEYRERIEV